jgi:hypothetical protein
MPRDVVIKDNREFKQESGRDLAPHLDLDIACEANGKTIERAITPRQVPA